MVDGGRGRGSGRTAAERAPAADQGPPVVPVRHPGRWVMVAVIAVLVAMLVHSLFFSHVVVNGVYRERFEWSVIDRYIFSGSILRGLVTTLELTVIAMVFGVALGVALAIMRLSPNPVVSGTAWTYVLAFRGTPVLVQLFLWEFAAYVYPTFSLGVPFGPALLHINLNSALTPLVAACLGLSLNEGAYMSEIVRAGIVSVDEGQTEAARSLGMSRLLALRLVVLPQAMRVIIPPTGNETISMLKTSSLASVITVPEMAYYAQQIANENLKPIPLFLVISIWYLAVTSVMMVGQYYLERYFARGSARRLPLTPWQRVRAGLLIRPGNQGFGRLPFVVGDEDG